MARTPKTVLTPRGYVSWSQLVLWEKDKPEYRRIYYYGGKGFSSKYTAFGSEVADDAEKGTSTRDTVKALNMLLPTYAQIEHKIDARIKTPKDGLLYVHGRLDTYENIPLRFRERKTGTVPWTQKKVDKHGQIDFYYMLIYLQSGKLPEHPAYLDWAETVPNNRGGMDLTGNIAEFIAERTLLDVFKMIQRVTKAALEIQADYKNELMRL